MRIKAFYQKVEVLEIEAENAYDAVGRAAALAPDGFKLAEFIIIDENPVIQDTVVNFNLN